jgi:short-subunit dehydrogenase
MSQVSGTRAELVKLVDTTAMHVAITGASSGIGEALAREYARVGARVTMLARRKERLDHLVAELGDHVRALPWDLSDSARACDWIDGAEAELGPLDVLINNAGMDRVAPSSQLDPELIDQMLRLNLHTPIRLSCFVLRRMLETSRRGTIVNVASVAALAAPPMQTCYGASKAGLAMFSETLRVEHRRTPVNVLTIYPGPVRSEMSEESIEAYGGRQSLAGAGPEGTPEVLAKKIRRAVERRRARLFYPGLYAITRYLPWLSHQIAGRLVDGTGKPPARRPKD